MGVYMVGIHKVLSMQNIAGVAVFLAIILFEVPSLVKNEEWRELTVFSLLLLIGILLSILGSTGFNFSRFYQ